ncbi:MAG: O-methyltransferase [Firmicutes bacterium]|nr:O-methyltransferase [Bacillota bacterium]
MDKTKNITNEKVTAYMTQFYQPADERLMELRLLAEADHVPIILRESEDFLGVLLSMVKPKRTLEIGTAVGYSAAYFAVKTGGQVVTIEKDEGMYQVACENVRKLKLTNQIRLMLGDGSEAITALEAEGAPPFDFIFIDAAKSHYKRFLDASMALAREETVIVSDNVLFGARVASDEYDPSGKHKTNIRRMREYIDYIYHHPRLETSVISCGDGLAISRVKE